MKVGLVRHFKVKHKFPKKLLLSASEVLKWFEEYEMAEIQHNSVDLCGVDWERCYSSPQERATKTAQTIFNGEITKSQELKELESEPFLKKNIRMPFLFWGMIIRKEFSSTNDTTNKFRTNISAFVESLLLRDQSNTLIVSHYFVMVLLQKELIKRGFKGKTFKSPEYGKVYVFEK